MIRDRQISHDHSFISHGWTKVSIAQTITIQALNSRREPVSHA